eukprot:12368985-Karenia_brevis.AAC.1
MEPGGSVQDPERIIFASFRPKVAKMTPPGYYIYMEWSQPSRILHGARWLRASFRPKVAKMRPPGSEPDVFVKEAERIIFASFRRKVAKMIHPGSYMEPGGSV